MNEHEQFQDRIAAYLAGGLPDDERVDFETHRASCADCARELDAMEQTEKTMTQLFGALIPSADFEDRLIGSLRFTGLRLRIHPMVRRAAIAASVALMLGGFGYVANHQMETGGLDFTRTRVASNLRQVGQGISLYANENKGGYPRAFFGGSTTQLDWADFKKSGDENGESYGDHHVEFPQNPFSGVQRDSLFARNRFQQIASDRNAPINSDDSVLLPPDDGRERASESRGENGGRLAITGRPIIVEKDKVTEEVSGGVTENLTSAGGYIATNGQNAYRGSVANAGDTMQVGTGHATNHALSPDVVAGKKLGLQAGSNLYFKPAEAATPTTPALVEQQVAQADTDKSEISRKPAAGFFFDSAADKSKSDEPKQQAAAPPEAKVPGDAKPAITTPANTGEHESIPTTQATVRKVIRNGDIEFEVDSFDSATVTITKIAIEEQGYIATTNSEKLPNGKVKGVIVVRIPPDHLDTLVLKLRALGDLKSQNLTAQDVTKQYTDTASELRAARAMEDRLLNIIKTSQGQIKDLLAAEKELATWREKIEKLEGEIRYYDSLVSLSTLNVSLFERDIKKADVLKETEDVDMGVETDDVEAQRAAAIKAIDDAKGRIVESELKKLDAGQLAAKVVAEIPPDASGPALDRLKQLGKVSRLEIHRSQKSANDQPATSDTKLERGETHLVLSLYNLANVAPRQTDNLNLAAADVEQAYNAILSRVGKSDGRVVTSNLNRQTDQQTSGVIQFEVKAADAETVLADIRKSGEVTRLTVAENPDTNNVTAAKRGFNVQIVSLASMLPREVNNRNIAAADVDKSYQALIESLRKANARIIVWRIEDAGKGQHNAYIDFEIPRTGLDEIEKDLSQAGETYNRSVNAATDADNVTDSKVQFKLSIVPATALAPRESDALAVEVNDVDAAAQSFQSAAGSAGGRVIDSNFSKDIHGQTARIVIEVPFANAAQIISQARQLGTVRGSQQSTNRDAPSGELARARVELTLASGDVLVAPEHGVMATLRNGLSTSFAGLMWSLQLIVIGLCLVAPWVFLIWLGAKMLKRARRKSIAPVT